MRQDEVFKNFEADRWYERNKEGLKPGNDLIVWLIDTYGLVHQDSAVLEVGASNGFRLERIREKYGCKVFAVEPSKKAVEDGKASFPEVEFYNITAEEIEFEADFELIIINSVFHWIDRKNLFTVFSKLDRALKDGGHLIIGDFQIPIPFKNPYHHLKNVEVYTYKQAYKEIFLSSKLYIELATICYNHDTKDFRNINLKNMFCVSLLKKQELYLRQDKML